MKPVFLIVDDEESLLVMKRELTRRYGVDYDVLGCTAPIEGLDILDRLKSEAREVALIVSALWLQGMTGVGFLAAANALQPSAQRALLLAYGDQSGSSHVVRAIALGQIDSVLRKPWEPAEEFLHPALAELLAEWSRGSDRPRFEAVKLVAPAWTPRSSELRDLMARTGLPYGFYPADSEPGRQLLREAGQEGTDLPVAMMFDGRVLVEPSYAELATALGVLLRPAPGRYDVAIVGAGPAGLSAAVSSASEGLRTVVLEPEAIGGQAGTSSRIRNYLGFTYGISGGRLASSAFQQALLFGADFVSTDVTGMVVRGPDRVLTLAEGDEIVSRTVIIATGVAYRRLGPPRLEALVGAGVFYGAALPEVRAMQGQEVFLVGGGNSAGQAAVHLAKYAPRVTLLVRKEGLAATMSDYLVREIEATPNITVRYNVQVMDGDGAGRLEQLVLQYADGTRETVPATALFVLIGAEPRTGWLADAVERDGHGYILTGRHLLANGRWPLERQPLPQETSVPGVFAAGDVRYRSVKRVASAVGEGAIAVQLVHSYFEDPAP
jgi:thioredoxin reductase (NADPH)